MIRSSDDDRDYVNAEVDALTKEMSKLFEAWQMRDADPQVVTTLMVTRLIALSYELFEEEAEGDHYVQLLWEQGKIMYEEMKGQIPNVH